MNTQYTYPQKPTLVNVIAWMTLACGIVNILWGLGASATALVTIIGIVCIPFTILPSILGIFEILYAAKLLNNPPQVTRPSTTIAVLEIACILTGNVFAMVVGILSLVFYNDQTVRDYFARLSGVLPPEPIPPAQQIPPVVPAAPAPVVEPVPSSTTVEEQAPVAAVPATPDEEPIPSPLTGEAPEAEIPLQPASSSATDETIISPRRTEEPASEPEPPSIPDETDPSQKTAEE